MLILSVILIIYLAAKHCQHIQTDLCNLTVDMFV